MIDDLVTRLKEEAEGAEFSSKYADLVAEAAARIEADAATIARLEGERERLALAICGGEDAPGYANAQTVEALEKVARDNAAAAMWQIDRTMKAEAKVAALVEALEEIAAEASVHVHTWRNGINFKKMYEGWRKIAVERIDIARAAIAAAKGGA